MSRIYFPIHAIGFANNGVPANTGSFRAAKGVQSLNTNTTFNLEQVFELGQSTIYENIENLPNVEVTAEKVIDGYALLQHLATPAAVSPTLVGRYQDNRCQAVVAYFPYTNDAASGTPLSYMFLSGFYVSSLRWNIPVEGNITEAITLVGNDKNWVYTASGTPFTLGTIFANTESPVAASGGVNRRENVNMTLSRWPTVIPGINASGINTSGSNGILSAHIQTVTINVSLNRTDLLELGRKGPYLRYLQVPAQVTTSIEVTPNAGSGDTVNVVANNNNLSDETIYIVLDAGTRIDLGTRNKLDSVTQQGGDTGGSNVSLTYNFSTFNDYTCRQTANDPAGL